MAKEGPKSLFKGAGANILRGVASAGVLAIYDKFQALMLGKVYSAGMKYLYAVESSLLILSQARDNLEILSDLPLYTTFIVYLFHLSIDSYIEHIQLQLYGRIFGPRAISMIDCR